MFSRNQTHLYTRLHSFPVGKSFQVITTNFQIKLKGIQTETGMLCTNVSVGSRTFVPFFLSFGIPRITIQSWPPSTTRILLWVGMGRVKTRHGSDPDSIRVQFYWFEDSTDESNPLKSKKKYLKMKVFVHFCPSLPRILVKKKKIIRNFSG